ETGYVAFKSAVMEGATREAARQVRTGIVQTAADAATRFRSEFCPNLVGLFPCTEFYFDVRTFADFNAIALPAVTYDVSGVPTNIVFAPGGANSVISVRVIHVHHVITPLLGQLMGGASATLPLLSTAVMRTEPYE
ncbi:MAG: pilus assembly protein, partial [Magnetospirillum sp.]|nr:pilus assembly protein [Magnetospirillum sp.]